MVPISHCAREEASLTNREAGRIVGAIHTKQQHILKERDGFLHRDDTMQWSVHVSRSRVRSAYLCWYSPCTMPHNKRATG